MSTNGTAAPIPGVDVYSRAAVDQFVAAVAEERTRLHTVIADATSRRERARGSQAVHQLMVTMVQDTLHELTARRRETEVLATRIVADAESEAQAIIRLAYAESGTPDLAAWRLNGGQEPSFDLTAAEMAERYAVADQIGHSPAQYDVIGAPTWGDVRAPASNGQPAESYFEFLRGALDDDQPLGPRGTDAGT